MKIVFKECISTKILNLIRSEVDLKAKQHSSVAYIEVTPDEAVEIYDDLVTSLFWSRTRQLVTSRDAKIREVNNSQLFGYNIKVLGY